MSRAGQKAGRGGSSPPPVRRSPNTALTSPRPSPSPPGSPHSVRGTVPAPGCFSRSSSAAGRGPRQCLHPLQLPPRRSLCQSLALPALCSPRWAHLPSVFPLLKHFQINPGHHLIPLLYTYCVSFKEMQNFPYLMSLSYLTKIMLPSPSSCS